MTDLTGHWTGVYSYPGRVSATPFDAEIRDHGGLISGVVSEIGDTPRSAGVMLESTISGDVRGNFVHFVKTYDDRVRSHQVLYEGMIVEDGQVIEGSWAIKSNWSGPFRMERRWSAEPIAVARETEEIVR